MCSSQKAKVEKSADKEIEGMSFFIERCNKSATEETSNFN